MNSLELRIPPVALVILFTAGMRALAYAVPAALHIPGRIPVAVALLVAGIIVALAGVGSFRRHKTTVDPMHPEQSSALVTTDIYRFSRNPMYLGFLLALAGWGVYLGNGAALLLLPAFVAYMNRFQIGPEERALRQLRIPRDGGHDSMLMADTIPC